MVVGSGASLEGTITTGVLSSLDRELDGQTYLQFSADRDFVFCVESEFMMQEIGERLRGWFLLMPDVASLHAMLRAIRLA